MRKRFKKNIQEIHEYIYESIGEDILVNIYICEYNIYIYMNVDIDTNDMS